MKIIDIDIYQQRVLIFDTYDSLYDYMNENNVDLDVELAETIESSRGIAGGMCYKFPLQDDKYGERNADFFLALNERKMDILAHEAIHSSWDILDNAGVKVTYKNHEMLSYLSQFIFREYCQAFGWKLN